MAETIKVKVPATIKFVRSPQKRRATGTGSAGPKRPGNDSGRLQYKNGGLIRNE